MDGPETERSIWDQAELYSPFNISSAAAHKIWGSGCCCPCCEQDKLSLHLEGTCSAPCLSTLGWYLTARRLGLTLKSMDEFFLRGGPSHFPSAALASSMLNVLDKSKLSDRMKKEHFGSRGGVGLHVLQGG